MSHKDDEEQEWIDDDGILTYRTVLWSWLVGRKERETMNMRTTS